MTAHLVDQIADAMVELLRDATLAEDRVTRDRPPVEKFDIDELPSIDVRIGADTPLDEQTLNHWTTEVQIFVDLYVRVIDRPVSEQLLSLRKESHQALMAQFPYLPGVTEVLKILPGGADEPLISATASFLTGSLRTEFFVTYRHSLTDPSV